MRAAISVWRKSDDYECHQQGKQNSVATQWIHCRNLPKQILKLCFRGNAGILRPGVEKIQIVRALCDQPPACRLVANRPATFLQDYPLSFLTSSISTGTASNRSPTMP